jgi:cob(I)alamin adenosyltransferase
MTHREFLDLVEEMRSLQKRWFGGDKSSFVLNRSRALERRVDRAIVDLKDDRSSLFPQDPE